MTTTQRSRQRATPLEPRDRTGPGREELLGQLHDVLQGRVRMSAGRFMELVKAINAA